MLLGEMVNKIKIIVFIFFLFFTAGLVHAIVALNNMPDMFDWNLEEDEDESY